MDNMMEMKNLVNSVLTTVNVRQIAAAHHNELGRVTLSLRERKEIMNVSRSYAHLFRPM
jgi:DNA-binding LytR/AlgR family response regulator